ncbi:hypothetical protein EMPG_17909 [Blastomyces silverae]|uniref:Uncharacterized protein n=1 Tax=Blastomyces silverae TaxID=2060906 RepID=A0A0H1BBH0_9EURO|nr:hypothetical protein EMPG_17909 [Blastomyces silverae]
MQVSSPWFLETQSKTVAAWSPSRISKKKKGSPCALPTPPVESQPKPWVSWRTDSNQPPILRRSSPGDGTPQGRFEELACAEPLNPAHRTKASLAYWAAEAGPENRTAGNLAKLKGTRYGFKQFVERLGSPIGQHS